MRWPRGKYNGMRIVGFDVRVRFDLCRWSLAWPSLLYGTCLSIGPLHVWFGSAYKEGNQR